MMATLQPERRQLTSSEQRLLQLKIHDLTSQRARVWKVLIVGAVTVVALWLTTIVASDAPNIVITLFWSLMAIVLAIWIWRDIRREHHDLDQMLAAVRSAERANKADVFHISARAFVEFEEIEDEGACFAFAIADGKVVFVVGQQFYRGTKFPSLDFVLVHILDESGQTVEEHIEKRGPSVEPARVVQAATKRHLAVPEHLEVVDAPLDNIEAALQPIR